MNYVTLKITKNSTIRQVTFSWSQRIMSLRIFKILKTKMLNWNMFKMSPPPHHHPPHTSLYSDLTVRTWIQALFLSCVDFFISLLTWFPCLLSFNPTSTLWSALSVWVILPSLAHPCLKIFVMPFGLDPNFLSMFNQAFLVIPPSAFSTCTFPSMLQQFHLVSATYTSSCLLMDLSRSYLLGMSSLKPLLFAPGRAGCCL